MPFALSAELAADTLSSGAAAPASAAGAVTILLRSARAGEPEAVDRLFPLVYDELRRLARAQLRRDPRCETLLPTGLVHEAYLKLAGGGLDAESRGHFFAIAARAMRQVLVDHARRRNADKRGGGLERTTLTEVPGAPQLDPAEFLALHDAIEELEPRQRQIVEYRFFAGLEEQEIAELLGISDRTVRRDWLKARAWLFRRLSPDLAG